MRLLRRLTGVVALLPSALGAAACVAGVVCVWVYYQKAAERTEAAALRVDAGLERVSTALGNVRRAVEQARTDVADVGKESADLGGGGVKGRLASRTVRTLIQQKAGPSIDDLGGRLAMLSDAAVAVSSLLQSLQDLPSSPHLDFDPDQLKRRADEAQQLSAALRRLEATLGDGDTGGREAAATAGEVDGVLRRCLSAVDEWQSSVDGAREDLARVTGRVFRWWTLGAVALTALLVWVGAGQVSLFAHALRWCRDT